MRRPISCTSSTAMVFHIPPFSMETGQKMCVLAKLVYFVILRCADWSAAAPGVTLVLAMWDSAYVTSHANGLPLAYRRSVVPSGRLLFSNARLTGSFAAGICARLMARQMTSFMWLWRCCLAALLRQDSPCSLRASTAFPHTCVRFTCLTA